MRGTHIVSLQWLAEHLEDERVVIADCRFQLGDPHWGKEQFELDHIPGAVYFDLEADLSDKIKEHGGRHPLPPLEPFTRKLGQAGIDEEKIVVVYDDQNGSMAARLWFLLKYLGHEKVYLLEQSYHEWQKQGFPTSNDQPQPTPTTFTANLQPNKIVDVNTVKQKLHHPDVVLVDARAPERYSGKNEPIDPVGGHIPGAVNECWKESLNEQGMWRSNKEQAKRLQAYVKQKGKKEFILYCGSGVTACANMIAFEQAGLQPKLYVGSWSDWSSYPELPKETLTDHHD